MSQPTHDDADIAFVVHEGLEIVFVVQPCELLAQSEFVFFTYPRKRYGSEKSTWQVEAKNVEATETFRRVQAEKHALDTRGALLAPQFRALEEGRAALEGDRREGETTRYFVFLQQHGYSSEAMH